MAIRRGTGSRPSATLKENGSELLCRKARILALGGRGGAPRPAGGRGFDPGGAGGGPPPRPRRGGGGGPPPPPGGPRRPPRGARAPPPPATQTRCRRLSTEQIGVQMGGRGCRRVRCNSTTRQVPRPPKRPIPGPARPGIPRRRQKHGRGCHDTSYGRKHRFRTLRLGTVHIPREAGTPAAASLIPKDETRQPRLESRLPGG